MYDEVLDRDVIIENIVNGMYCNNSAYITLIYAFQPIADLIDWILIPFSELLTYNVYEDIRMLYQEMSFYSMEEIYEKVNSFVDEYEYLHICKVLQNEKAIYMESDESCVIENANEEN